MEIYKLVVALMLAPASVMWIVQVGQGPAGFPRQSRPRRPAFFHYRRRVTPLTAIGIKSL